MSYLIESSEKAILWIILISPMIISIVLYIWVRFIMSKRSYEDEEMMYPIVTSIPPSQQITTTTDNNTHALSTSPPPPSYIASHKDRIYELPNKEAEKPPMYPYPPSYDYAVGPEDVPLSEIQLRIIENRQRLLLNQHTFHLQT
ncbi:unnamed protein product [Cunninghamella echinulata]